MRRREFITAITGSAVAWSFVARAQQPDQMRRIGVIISYSDDDPEARPRLAALVRGLQELGWTDGRNIHIDYRYTAGDAERTRRYAAELVALAPDVILAGNTSTMGALQQATRIVPIVFAGVVDPVGAGFVDSLAHPGGNITGFTQFEYGLGGKWIELLKEIAPRVTRVAVLRDVTAPVAHAEFASVQTVAPSLQVEISPVGVGDADEIERGIANFARGSNGGLVVASSPATFRFRKLITTLAIRHRLPAVYPFRYFVDLGGLVSYGSDRIDQFRRAAGYIDRILKGDKPADLPVQAPTTYELVVNLKTAKALGLTVPSSVLARADEVIE